MYAAVAVAAEDYEPTEMDLELVHIARINEYLTVDEEVLGNYFEDNFWDVFGEHFKNASKNSVGKQILYQFNTVHSTISNPCFGS